MTINETDGGSRPAIDNSTSASSFGYSVNATKQQVSSGRTTVALVRNLSSRRDPTLFDTLTPKQKSELRKMYPNDEPGYRDRYGRLVTSSKYQTKMIFALSWFLYQYKDEGLIKQCIEEFSKGNDPGVSPRIEISIKELTKKITSDNTARQRQRIDSIKELFNLSQTFQVLRFYDAKGQARAKVQPLITLGGITLSSDFETLKDALLETDSVTVIFSPVFVMNLNNRFVIVKDSIFRIWGKRGSGTDTELFGRLLSLLLAEYTHRRLQILTAQSRLKKGDFKDKSSYLEAIAQEQKKAYIYDAPLEGLMDMCDTYSSRKQKMCFFRDLECAVKALKNESIGLILDAKRVGDSMRFYLNPDYNKDQPDDLRLIDSPAS